MAILTLHGHFHLAWTFLPHMAISHLMWPFLTSHGCFYLTLSFLTSSGHSHLAWAFSPHVAIVIVGGYPPGVPLPLGRKSSHMHHNTVATSHLSCTLHAPLHVKIISFTLCGKNSPKKS